MRYRSVVVAAALSLFVLSLGMALTPTPAAAQPSVNNGFDGLVPRLTDRPGMLIETDYYVYGPGTGFTEPEVNVEVQANGFKDPVTLYVYWHDRVNGAQLFYNLDLGFTALEIDLLGQAGAPRRIRVPPLKSFQLFGPEGAFGPVPAIIPGTTGRYQFVIEIRDADGAGVISRSNALYNYVDGVVTKGGDIAAERWSARNVYFLESPVNVTQGTLRIDPGTVILGSKAGQGTLVIQDDAQIDADGKALDPIIMTSELPVGERAPGDWGGLVVNGQAPTNQGTNPRPEGEGNSGPFGGVSPNHSSGVMRYMRVEFAGIRFSEQNELNGIALQGVGRGTEIDHIQVHFNQDDGIEFFGGTADAKYLLITGAEDDSLDWTFGWRGRLQHFVAIQFGTNEQDNGIEADNFETNEDASPISAPTIRNATWVGDLEILPDSSDDGNVIRRGSEVTMENAVIAFFDEGIKIDGDRSNAQVGSGITYNNVILHDNNIDSNVSLADLGTVVSADPGFFNDPLGRPGGGITPDVCIENGDNASSGRGFFDAAPWIGGVDPEDQWIDDGWTTFSDN